MKFRRIVATIITALLLSSCAAQTDVSPLEKAESQAPSTDTMQADTETPTSGTPEALKLDDLQQLLEQELSGIAVTLLNTTEIGEDYILVEYENSSFNSFALYDKKTGSVENIPVMDVVLKNAVSENYLIFEKRGEYTDSAFRFFPSIVRCIRVSDNTANDNFSTLYEPELFKLDRSVKAGNKNNELLGTIAVTLDGFQVIFKPSGSDDIMFYAAATTIPETKTSYDPNTRQFTVEIVTDTLDAGIKSGVDIPTDENLYFSSYRVTVKDGITYLTATLREETTRYTIQEKHGPLKSDGMDELPYFVLTFYPAPDIPLDY